MVTVDIRAAAQQEAEQRWQKFSPSDTRLGAFESDAFIDGAVWASERLTPTREQIAEVLDSHTRRFDTGACCGWVLDNPDHQYLHWADAILDLMSGLAEGENPYREAVQS